VSWFAINTIPLLGIAGILFDIVGAVLVAWEVVNQYRGKQFQDQFTFDPSVALAPPETESYKAWARLKFRRMKAGLVLLVFGFSLQLVANALQLKSAS
jgi:hypothetical protein